MRCFTSKNYLLIQFRFPKRVYVRMPDTATRVALIKALMTKNGTPLSEKVMNVVLKNTTYIIFIDLQATH